MTGSLKNQLYYHVAEMQIMCLCWDCFKQPISAFYLGHTLTNLPLLLSKSASLSSWLIVWLYHARVNDTRAQINVCVRPVQTSMLGLTLSASSGAIQRYRVVRQGMKYDLISLSNDMVEPEMGQQIIQYSSPGSKQAIGFEFYSSMI